MLEPYADNAVQMVTYNNPMMSYNNPMTAPEYYPPQPMMMLPPQVIGAIPNLVQQNSWSNPNQYTNNCYGYLYGEYNQPYYWTWSGGCASDMDQYGYGSSWTIPQILPQYNRYPF